MEEYKIYIVDRWDPSDFLDLHSSRSHFNFQFGCEHNQDETCQIYLVPSRPYVKVR